MEENFTILIQGYNGVGAFRDPHEKRVPVLCTEKELEMIAIAMVKSYYAKYDSVCCVAAKGDYVSNSEFDYLFADCI